MSAGHDVGVAVRRPWAFAAMTGSVLGAALQLQQPALWPGSVYGCLLLFGAAGLWWARRLRYQVGFALGGLALLLGLIAGLGLAGARASAYAAGALDPAMEGRDLQVVGVVAQMPQRSDGALRFRLEVESPRGPSKIGRASCRERVYGTV